MVRSLLLFGLAATGASLAAPLTSRSSSQIQARKSLALPFSQRPQISRRSLQKRQSGTDVAQLYDENDSRYIVTITIAGEQLDVILDTGSSDTFVYSVQPTGLDGIPASDLPALFSNTSAQGVMYTPLVYNASYGAGNGITDVLGATGFTSVSLNGTNLTSDNQTFANIYTSDSPTGASGLLGLGFPLNAVIWPTYLEYVAETTGAYPPLSESQAYFPIVPRLYQQGAISQQLFCLEASRLGAAVDAPNTDLGYNTTLTNGTLTIGDYPTGYQESDFTFSAVPTVSFNEQGQQEGLPAATGNRWTLPLEAIYFNGQLLSNTTQQTDVESDGGVYYALIDSGNPSIGLPSDVISQITPAWAANPQDATIPCDSEFNLVLQFGGKNFSLETRDVLVPSYEAIDSLGFGGSATNDCQFQAQESQPDPDELGPGTSITYQLGDPFLRNVVAAFDYGNILDSTQSAPRIGLVSTYQS